MSDEAWQAFSQRVAYEDNLPLAIGPRRADAMAASLVEERNGHVINMLVTLEERRPDIGDDGGAIMQELARLDNRLNVLMDLVSRLLMPDSALPPRLPIKLNAFGAEIPAVLRPAGYERSHFLTIHFDACRALPLMLPVRFEGSHAADRVFVSFEALKPAVTEGLEKLVFRQHRRKVAEARQSPP